MKKFICFMALFLASNSFAIQLHNVEQMKAAVMEGKPIRMVVDYSRCADLTASKLVANNHAIYTPDVVKITRDGNLETAILYFTLNDPHHPAKAVYQYLRYAFSGENTLLLTFTTLNAADYALLDGSGSMQCKLDESVNVYV
jgi:hypothetical protein